MKKAFSLLLAAAMCTAMLAGCGSNGGDGNAANNGSAGGAENIRSIRTKCLSVMSRI